MNAHDDRGQTDGRHAALGVCVLGEAVTAGDETVFALGVAVAVMVVATAALARGEAETVEARTELFPPLCRPTG